MAGFITELDNMVASGIKGAVDTTGAVAQRIGGVSFTTETVQGSTRTAGFMQAGTGRGTVKEAQILQIKSKQVGTVRALLQDDFSMNTESMWDSIVPTDVTDSMAGALTNRLLQLVSGGRWSLFNKMTSRRFWKGTTPLSIPLSLKLRAETDAKTEVVDACEMLQAMSLPNDAGLSFLAPPGPSPYWANGNEQQVTAQSVGAKSKEEFDKAFSQASAIINASDQISIRWGNFMLFSNVIIKTVGVKFYNQIHKSGYPIGADVELVFETFSVVSKADLAKIYTAVNQ